MTLYEKFLHKAFDGSGINLAGADIRAVFCSSAYTPDTSDEGHEFHSDLTGILHTETMSSVTWANRVLDCADFTVTDPGGATTATQLVWVLWVTDTNDSILIGVDDITDVTFDGTNDDATVNANGIFRLGGA